MPAITGGAALLKALLATGTGEAKLEPVMLAVEKAVADGKPLTAKETVELIEQTGVGPHTVEKAQSLAATGEWAPPPPMTEFKSRLDRLVESEAAAAKPAKVGK